MISVKKVRLDKGAYCPRCDNVTRVLRSKRVAGGVRRRRHCLTCGHRFTTREIGNELYKELIKCRNYAAEVARLLKKNLWRLYLSLPLGERRAGISNPQPPSSESGRKNTP